MILRVLVLSRGQRQEVIESGVRGPGSGPGPRPDSGITAGYGPFWPLAQNLHYHDNLWRLFWGIKLDGKAGKSRGEMARHKALLHFSFLRFNHFR